MRATVAAGGCGGSGGTGLTASVPLLQAKNRGERARARGKRMAKVVEVLMFT